MADIAANLSAATGREIAFVNVPHDAFIEELTKSGAPKDAVWMLGYLFSTVLDGRTAHVLARKKHGALHVRICDMPMIESNGARVRIVLDKS
ncbi:MAG: hypothetical protein AAF559_11230 [Pseudomonadota bacterium]